jgi:hypothetical protein
MRYSIMESWKHTLPQQPQEQSQRRNRGITTQSARNNLLLLSRKTVPAVMVLIGSFLVLILTIPSSYCDAFVTSPMVSSRNHHHLGRHCNTITRSKKLSPQLSPPNNRHAYRDRRLSTFLQVAKTGGKMIDTEEQFSKLVLAKDVPRPVMVFFSAPW